MCSTVADHDKCGDIMSTVGCSVLWGGYLEYRAGISSVPWGNILSTVGDVQYCGGIIVHVGIS